LFNSLAFLSFTSIERGAKFALWCFLVLIILLSGRSLSKSYDSREWRIEKTTSGGASRPGGDAQTVDRWGVDDTDLMPRAKQPLLVGVGGTLAPLEELRALEPASLFQIRICAAPWKRKEIKSSAFGGPGKESNWRAGFFLFERNEKGERGLKKKTFYSFHSLQATSWPWPAEAWTGICLCGWRGRREAEEEKRERERERKGEEKTRLPPLFFASSLCFFFYSFNQINKKRAFEPLLPPLSLSLSLSLFLFLSLALSLPKPPPEHHRVRRAQPPVVPPRRRPAPKT
jgi:hypothetical protein